MLTRLDKLTIDFILAVIITDCLVGFFVWHEVIYNADDSRLATAVGIGAGIAISLAVTIVVFAHWELVRMISERYKRLRYEQGLEDGKKLGREEAQRQRDRVRERVEEFLTQSGVEISDQDRERLFGKPDENNSQ